MGNEDCVLDATGCPSSNKGLPGPNPLNKLPKFGFGGLGVGVGGSSPLTLYLYGLMACLWLPFDQIHDLSEDPGLALYFLGVMGWGDGDSQVCRRRRRTPGIIKKCFLINIQEIHYFSFQNGLFGEK